MDYQAHLIGGVGLAAGVAYLIKPEPVDIILFCGAAAVGSIIPDIDHPKSYIGKRTGLFSELLYKTFGHRTITHSLITATIFLEFGLFIWGFNYIVLGLFLGIVSHILLDMMTIQGVEVFYPIKKKRFKFLK